MKKRKALWGHDFESSGKMKEFLSGEILEGCFVCGWPFDEHPNHPSRVPNSQFFGDRERCIEQQKAKS